MSDKVRVRNVTKYDIGLTNQAGIGYNIKPGLFITMTREDAEYNMAIAPKLFAPPARLIVEDQDLNEVMGIDHTANEIIDEAVAEKYLKGAAPKLRTWLEENNQPHVLEIVFQVAEKLDLPASKAKILKDFMPARDLMEE